MNIRPAVKEDAVAAARLLYDALHDVAHQLTGQESEEDAVTILEQFLKDEEGRLSYHQSLVSEVEGKTAGIIVTYAGDEAERLDRPIVERLRKLKNDPSISLDKEADEDEFYIDTLSVSPQFKGQGIGSALMHAAEERAKERGYNKIALAVVTDNKRAYSLYLRSGYEVDKEIIINHHVYYHMVKHL
ncbi:Acetyltransferase (GNAT) family protein [Paenibacillus uliginis N3/975]|uniref:Acetyltransferase (GNAT) family protein n=1 Tax=Paenibacillus uliginis N3/975 TaxID=1313296 RepID=A0A1X7GRA6_9BACL|nr:MULTISPECIES: GNAT family N-acetyltransferase [Paenibacillus]UNK17556.1 GNAT family N-acetyltransferase [Paenibacillus sp. N3/727]SMF73541.1 Acetyltransferase (GNAT) family protein [Paenibacillus uliginis N3/975]